METSLNDPDQYEKAYSTLSGLQVTAPLLQCVERLKEKLASISKLHKERFEEVKSKSHYLSTLTIRTRRRRPVLLISS